MYSDPSHPERVQLAREFVYVPKCTLDQISSERYSKLWIVVVLSSSFLALMSSLLPQQLDCKA